MSDAPAMTTAPCWTSIGVWGDGSCPTLKVVGHCRNCDVYRAEGRKLLERAPPPGYLEEWSALLEVEKPPESTATFHALVFRVGQTWLALRALSLREVTPVGTIRRVPHRPPEVLLGLASVRGEIHPCISLHALFGDVAAGKSRQAQFVVAQHQGHAWIFPVDEVRGVYEFESAAIAPLPVTLSHVGTVYTTGIVTCDELQVGLVDDDLLFSALERRLG